MKISFCSGGSLAGIDTDIHAVLFALQAEFECINSKKKQKKKGYKNSGVVSVKLCQVP